MKRQISCLAAASLVAITAPSMAAPPFDGTVWIDPDIITENDPSTFERLTYIETAPRQCFDHRVGDWSSIKVHIYQADYTDGVSSEFWVNTEFDLEEADTHAAKFARTMGRLPTVLRECAEASEIHNGNFSSGANSSTSPRRIHNYVEHWLPDAPWKDFLEETLVHETAHTCEREYRDSKEWQDAKRDDPEFVSEYAERHPNREDFAETFLAWLTVRFKQDRVPQSHTDAVLDAIPNRLAFLDEFIGQDMLSPLQSPMRRYTIPFLPSADRRGVKGFVRLVNTTTRDGEARITATDDHGTQHEPITLTLRPGTARHVSSRALEDEIGDGKGDWWIVITADPDIIPTAMIREADGAITPLTTLGLPR